VEEELLRERRVQRLPRLEDEPATDPAGGAAGGAAQLARSDEGDVEMTAFSRILEDCPERFVERVAQRRMDHGGGAEPQTEGVASVGHRDQLAAGAAVGAQSETLA